MNKPSHIIALLLALGVLVVSGAALALSRTQIQLPLAQEERSLFADRVSLQNFVRSSTGDWREEYLTLTIAGSYSDPIRISGWSLSNGSNSIKIPEGTLLLRQGIVNTVQPIALYPGEEVLISFDRSPVGVSFRNNSCSPLLEKFQKFIPPLNTTTSTRVTDGFYNDCILAHERDADFYSRQWRVFVSASSSLFSDEHGTLTLRDDKGLVVTTLSY